MNAPVFSRLGAFLEDAQMLAGDGRKVDASKAGRALAFGNGFPSFAIAAGLRFKLSWGVVRRCYAFEFDPD